MKAAFLIGVSSYDSLNPLPACEKDVSIMEDLLRATNNYEQIRVAKNNTKADAIKSDFRKFAEGLVEESVEELFIYFSGHGFQNESEMFLCCSDYNEQRPETTSLTNSEIDELIRTIAPELTVKVIDACQSGYQYIKDVDISKKIAAKSINKFIFMASSQQEESSFADQNMSFFTRAFFEAAVSKKVSESVYYRDIQSYIADNFRNFPQKQTPLFVAQTTGLEIFATSNDDIKALESTYKNSIQQAIKGTSVSERILMAINNIESYYLSKADIDSLLRNIEPSRLTMDFFNELSKNLYEIADIDSISLQNIGSDRKIAVKVVNNEKWKNECFITIVNEPYKVRQLREDLSGFERMAAALDPNRKFDNSLYETVTRERIASIKVNYEMPFDCLRLHLKPSKLCLEPWNSFLFLIPARIYCVVALGFVKLDRVSWDEFSLLPHKIEWLFEELPWRDWRNSSPVDKLINETEKRLRQDVLQLTGLVVESEDEGSEDKLQE